MNAPTQTRALAPSVQEMLTTMFGESFWVKRTKNFNGDSPRQKVGDPSPSLRFPIVHHEYVRPLVSSPSLIDPDTKSWIVVGPPKGTFPTRPWHVVVPRCEHGCIVNPNRQALPSCGLCAGGVHGLAPKAGRYPLWATVDLVSVRDVEGIDKADLEETYAFEPKPAPEFVAPKSNWLTKSGPLGYKPKRFAVVVPHDNVFQKFYDTPEDGREWLEVKWADGDRDVVGGKHKVFKGAKAEQNQNIKPLRRKAIRAAMVSISGSPITNPEFPDIRFQRAPEDKYVFMLDNVITDKGKLERIEKYAKSSRGTTTSAGFWKKHGGAGKAIDVAMNSWSRRSLDSRSFDYEGNEVESILDTEELSSMTLCNTVPEKERVTRGFRPYVAAGASVTKNTGKTILAPTRFWGIDNPDVEHFKHSDLDMLCMPANAKADLFIMVEVHNEWHAASKGDDSMSMPKLAAFIRGKYARRRWHRPKSDPSLGLGLSNEVENFVTETLRTITPDKIRRFIKDAVKVLRTRELKTRKRRSDAA